MTETIGFAWDTRAAFDLIVSAEVSDEAWYSVRLRGPPGPARIPPSRSDAAMMSPDAAAGPGGKIPDAMLKALDAASAFRWRRFCSGNEQQSATLNLQD
ncbi:hypothetical protein QA635_08445 [Bradyrhizobium brasilense]|uniref:hypothetical protein n=1 Tax=Bradyrhizobium brasilense TaxID=1419277 RepID=UPI0024B23A7A|nr:hypothetical protein [Bradyrhizobium australafricanum]WFU34429.1 hypothetical protein QA635_08445 [Bradyrhizobium australafricanum]